MGGRGVGVTKIGRTDRQHTKCQCMETKSCIFIVSSTEVVRMWYSKQRKMYLRVYSTGIKYVVGRSCTFFRVAITVQQEANETRRNPKHERKTHDTTGTCCLDKVAGNPKRVRPLFLGWRRRPIHASRVDRYTGLAHQPRETSSTCTLPWPRERNDWRLLQRLPLKKLHFVYPTSHLKSPSHWKSSSWTHISQPWYGTEHGPLKRSSILNPI